MTLNCIPIADANFEFTNKKKYYDLEDWNALFIL